jgi:serine protease Do
MTKTKSRILTALALSTALTAPALIYPLFTAPAAIAAPQVVQDFSDLAAKVSPAVVNVAVTMKVGGEDGEDARMSGPQDRQMEEFMQRFAERFGQPMQPGERGKPQGRPDGKQRPAEKGQAVGTGFIVDAGGTIVTNYHVVGKADSITVTLTDGRKLPGQADGRRREDRPRPAEGREQQAAAVRLLRRRQQGARRPAGDGGRQSVRPGRHRDDRHRVGARP